MARVTVNPTHDMRKIAELAGGNPRLIMFHPDTSELEVTDVTQAALTTAFNNYVADQANIDAATAADKETALRDEAKTNFDAKRTLKGMALYLKDELNALRAIEGLPALTNADVRNGIRNAIDNLP